MEKIWKPLLLFGLSLFAVQLVRADPEPPVINYMSNLYQDPTYHDDGRHSHGQGYGHQQHTSDTGYQSEDLGGFDDVQSSPYHHSSEEKGPTGYISSSNMPESEDEEHYDVPPTKGYGGSYSKGQHRDRGYSPSYGRYRPTKKGYSGDRPRPSYGSPYSSSKGKGSRPGKYGSPPGYSGSYPYGKGSPNSSPYAQSEEHSPTSSHSHEDEPPSATQSYKGSSGGGYSPNSNGYKAVEEYAGGYVPSAGYQPDGWYNTMKGGYDDYGYNDHNPKATGYKGPGQGKMYSSYSAPSLSEHSPKETYSYGKPEFSPVSAYGEHHDDEESNSKGPSSYSSSLYSSKGSRRPPPSNGYGQNPYFTNYKGSTVKTTYGTPKVTYSYSSLPKPSYGPPKKQYSSSKGSSSYGAPSSAYGAPSSSYGKGPSYEGYGPPSKYSSSGKGDFSNYYRTRSGGFARKPQIMRSMTGYNYKYSTIGKPNSRQIKPRHELENGQSEDYGPYNWENEGWTVTH